MEDSYLTPTLTGQYCSYIEVTGRRRLDTDINDGEACVLTYYNALDGVDQGDTYIETKKNYTDGTAVTFCLDPIKLI
jgi:hypothetical protein